MIKSSSRTPVYYVQGSVPSRLPADYSAHVSQARREQCDVFRVLREAPQWHNCLRVQLLVSAQVMISGLWDRAPPWAPCSVCFSFSLFHPSSKQIVSVHDQSNEADAKWKSSIALFRAKHRKPNRLVGAMSYKEVMTTTLTKPLPRQGHSLDKDAPQTMTLMRPITTPTTTPNVYYYSHPSSLTNQPLKRRLSPAHTQVANEIATHRESCTVMLGQQHGWPV